MRPGTELLRALLAALIAALAIAAAFWVMSAPNGFRALLPFGGPLIRGVVIHHSASPPVLRDGPVTEAAIDRWHESRGWAVVESGKTYHIGYNYVILQNGTVQDGRPVGVRGAHAGVPYYNERYVGICLVGDFDAGSNPDGRHGPTTPPAKQLVALERLIARLRHEYGFGVRSVLAHKEVKVTACPGSRFPLRRLRAALRAMRDVPLAAGPTATNGEE